MNIFYVYEHWRPDLDICFYVGKGKNNRARSFHPRNKCYRKIVQDLSDVGICVEVRMVASALTEYQAFDVERQRIKFWRDAGVELSNKTDGGEGFSGFIRPLGIPLSEVARQKLSEARKGIRFTEEHRAKLAAKKIGKARPPFTDETRAKMREASLLREQAKREKHGPNVRRDSRIKDTA